MKPAQISGDVEHREISTHLEYELRMLVHSARECQTAPSSDDGRAYLESFLVHARNLIAFLYDQDSTHDDLLAERIGNRFSVLVGE